MSIVFYSKYFRYTQLHFLQASYIQTPKFMFKKHRKKIDKKN